MIRDFVEYYNDVKKQYFDMLNELNDMTELVSTNAVSPEFLDNIKLIIDPLKDNFEKLSYVMFLLNQPAKKEKQKKYCRTVKELESKLNLDDKYSPKKVLEVGDKVLLSAKDKIKEIEKETKND